MTRRGIAVLSIRGLSDFQWFWMQVPIKTTRIVFNNVLLVIFIDRNRHWYYWNGNNSWHISYRMAYEFKKYLCRLAVKLCVQGLHFRRKGDKNRLWFQFIFRLHWFSVFWRKDSFKRSCICNSRRRDVAVSCRCKNGGLFKMSSDWKSWTLAVWVALPWRSSPHLQ